MTETLCAKIIEFKKIRSTQDPKNQILKKSCFVSYASTIKVW